MYVIAGLGNPGLRYRKTRHNAGFQALDALADTLGVRLSKRSMSGLWGEGNHDGERLILVKPQTYMNLSGDCLQQVLHYFRVPAGNLIVLYDDIELPLGSLRIRSGGSAGTHNGMKSVIACVGTGDFPRIRIGVGSENREGDLKDFVLDRPSKADQKKLEETFRNAADAALLIVSGNIDKAQAAYNRKHEGKSAD